MQKYSQHVIAQCSTSISLIHFFTIFALAPGKSKKRKLLSGPESGRENPLGKRSKRYSQEMPLYWKFMPMLRASHATTTFTQQAAGADDWTACADPVVCMMTLSADNHIGASTDNHSLAMLNVPRIFHQWRCYMKHTGERGVGPPQSYWLNPAKSQQCSVHPCWQLNFENFNQSDPVALSATTTDEDGSGGSATTGMCHF